MSKQTFILSSAGLKNIILPANNRYININSYDDDFDQFRFVIGKKEIKMNRFFAEFISSRVSHIHHSDPTIDSIFLEDVYQTAFYNSINNNNNKKEKEQISNNFEELFSDEIIQIIKNLSSGYEIEINRKISIKLSLISLIIGNEEIYQQINKLFSFEIDENEWNIDYMIERLRFFHNFFEDKQIIDFISSHFYKIDQNKLKKLPKSILYSIISNPKLIICNEDSLLEFINQIFTNNNDNENKEDEYNNIFLFYENIEFLQLDESTFLQFISQFDYTKMTNTLWKKLCRCFQFDFSITNQSTNKVPLTRYFESYKCHEFIYDSFFDNQFNGIIHYLTEKCHGNVHHKGIVSVTASSYLNYLHFPKSVVNLDDNKNYYQSAFNDKDAWICYDFNEFKVKPTHYSIRSRHNASDVNGSPCNWLIEGSNDNINWVILDTRKEETSLKYANASNVFEIQRKLRKDEFYRFLRMKKSGADTAGNNYFTISALEYFGIII